TLANRSGLSNCEPDPKAEGRSGDGTLALGQPLAPRGKAESRFACRQAGALQTLREGGGRGVMERAAAYGVRELAPAVARPGALPRAAPAAQSEKLKHAITPASRRTPNASRGRRRRGNGTRGSVWSAGA